MPLPSRVLPSRKIETALYKAYTTSRLIATSSPIYRQQPVCPSLVKPKTTPCPVSRASVGSVPSNVSPAVTEEVERCFSKLDLSFRNTREAFKSKTNYEVIRALLVLKLCSVDLLVRHNARILQILRKVCGKRLFNRILKSSFYGHFVGGETLNEVAPAVQKMRLFGVKSILDYSVESDITQEEAEEKAVEGIIGDDEVSPPLEAVVSDALIKQTHEQFSAHKEFGDRRLEVVAARTYFYAGEHECDKNVDIFCQSIDSVAEATRREGFTAIKLTALGRPQLLLKISETIVQTQNFFKALTGSSWETLFISKISQEDLLKKLNKFGIKVDDKLAVEWFKSIEFDDDGFVDFYKWGHLFDKNPELSTMFQVLNIRTGKIQPLIEKLSDCEEQQFANMMQRMIHVADHAAEKGVRIMIDAEHTYFQPAISKLTMAMMRRYNKEGGQILNTYQAYLRSALSNIEVDMSLARREKFHFGCKLVRGAYMDQERKRAKAIGYDDPINPNYEATTQMYNRCLERIIQERQERGPGQVSVMVASHNEDAIRYAVQLMKDNTIAPSERVICFAQLFGMCDQVSFSLGQAGYSVYKYVPYGPVEDVIPYLSRRALENGGMLEKVQTERSLLWSELRRRLASGQLVHKVPTA